MGELDNLKKYLSEAHPVVNKLLRANEDASKYTFDSMFEDSEVPQPLYRLIDNEHVFFRIESLKIKDICHAQQTLIHL